MGTVVIEPGRQYNLVTPEDLAAGLETHRERLLHSITREEIRGVKPIRGIIRSTAAVTATAPFGVQGPEAGFVWAFRRISLNSDTAAVAINVNRTTDATSIPLPQAYVTTITTPNLQIFSSYSLLLFPSEFLLFSTAGTPGFLYGTFEATEVPAERIGGLLT